MRGEQAEGQGAEGPKGHAHVRGLRGRDADVLPFGSTVAARHNAPVTNSTPRVLFTGRLIPRKGVEYLLRAAKIVQQTHALQVVITGDGKERPRLESICRDLQLDDAVPFLGFVENQRLDEEYARCDVWVNPAIIDDRGDTEGLGVGAVEAYAHGKPVIASRVGGIPDAVVHNQTGLLVPEKDSSALAQAIVELITDKEKSARLARGGLQLVRERFNWDRITDRLEMLYLESICASLAVATGSARTRPALRRENRLPIFGARAERSF